MNKYSREQIIEAASHDGICGLDEQLCPISGPVHDWLPGESLFSLIARNHYYRGQQNPAHTIDAFFARWMDGGYRMAAQNLICSYPRVGRAHADQPDLVDELHARSNCWWPQHLRLHRDVLQSEAPLRIWWHAFASRVWAKVLLNGSLMSSRLVAIECPSGMNCSDYLLHFPRYMMLFYVATSRRHLIFLSYKVLGKLCI